MLSFFISIILISSMGISLAGEISDAEWADIKKKALERPRRVIINNDGVDLTWIWLKKDKPVTQEKFNAKRMNTLLGKEVDTVSYAPFGVGMRVITRSKVTDVFYAGSKGLSKKTYNPTRELHARGTDALELAVNFCRKNNLEIFASMRVNDTHDSWGKGKLTPFKHNHPEYIVGSRNKHPNVGAWTAYDFAMKPVRDRFIAVCKEFFDNYDIDGLELDFNRWPMMFRSVAWKGQATPEDTEKLTGMMREIRKAGEKIGRKHGKPRLLAINIPDSLEVCKVFGMDIKTWCKENLVDILIIGSDASNYLPKSKAVAEMKQLGKPVYMTCSVPNMGRCMRNDHKKPFDRNSVESQVGLSAAALSAKPDGLNYFNTYCIPGTFSKVRRNLNDLALFDKIYHITPGGVLMNFPAKDKYRKYSSLYPKSPKMLSLGEKRRFILDIGDNFAVPDVAAANPDITLYLEAIMSSKSKLKISINGKTVKKLQKQKNYTWTVSVPASYFKQGENIVEITNVSSAGIKYPYTVLSGRHGPIWTKPAPWYYLNYQSGAVKNSRGACRITDKSNAGTVGFIYLLPKREKSPLKIDFKLKTVNSNAEQAIICRLANGKYVEAVTFGNGKVGLKYAKKSVSFKSSDKYHQYSITMTGNRITINADGEKLLNAILTVKRTNPSAVKDLRKQAPMSGIDSSIIIGSLSDSGTGSAWWRDMKFNLDSSVILCDFALVVKFPVNKNK